MSVLSKYIQSAAGIGQRRTANAWNLSTAVPDYNDDVPYTACSSFGAASIQISRDGTKLFIVNYFSVEEYSLGTPWKLATRSYTATNIFLPKLTDIYSGSISSDGLTLLLILTNKTLVTYRLGTAWNLSTVQEPTPDAKFASLPGVLNSISDVVMKPDGTILYVLGLGSRYVYQYALSTPFDLSTISLTYSIDMAPYTSITPLEGMDFKTDGTVLYITSQSFLARFPLSTAWNISSISTGTTTFGFPPSYTTKGIRMSPEGNYFYAIDDLNNNLDQYTTDTPWVFSSASKTSNVSIAATASTSRTLSFSSDGANIYVSNGQASSSSIVQYKLTSPWNVNSISSTSTFNPRIGIGNYIGYAGLGGISFNNSGNTMYVASGDEHFMFAYSLSESWNVQSATISNTSTSMQHLSQMTSNAAGLAIANNGLSVYTVSSDNIYQYTMGSYMNTASLAYSSNVYNPRIGFGSLTNLAIQEDGGAIFTTIFNSRILVRLPMSTPFLLTPSSANTTASITGVDRAEGIFIKGDNTHLYVNDDVSTVISDITYDFSANAISLSIASAGAGYLYLNRYLSDGERTADYTGIYFKPDGKQAYFMNGSRYVFSSTFSNSWNLSSLSGGVVSNTRSTGTTTNVGLFFRPNGGTYYNISVSSPYESVAPYNVAPPWSVSSTSATTRQLTDDTNMVKVVFSNDGTRMFSLGKSNNRIYAYNLSTAWSISTATLSTSYSIGSNSWTDMIIATTGKHIFVSTSTGQIYRITLATAWDLATVSSMALNLTLANTYSSGGDFNIAAMHITPYGDRLFVAGSDKMLVQSYTIT
jgi:hypothetical protein